MIKFKFFQLINNTLLIVCAILFISTLLTITRTIDASESQSKSQRPKIGLVLGGGGARGSAHIGVIKVLEELRIPVDYITGTSMGSIVGGLYASGMSSRELETVIVNIDWDDAFDDATNRENRSFRLKQQDLSFLVKSSPGFNNGELMLPVGLIEGQKLNFILKSLTLPVVKTNNFDELSIPFRTVATDIETGDAVVLDSGDLAYAMRASMSVPGVFSPMRIDDKLLVDGGVVNNVPIDIARTMGADIIIAVDVGTPLLAGNEIKSIVNVIDQVTGLMTNLNVKAQIKTLKKNDILIRPNLGDLGSADFNRSAEGIIIGEKAARDILQQLQTLSVSEEEYKTYVTEHENIHEPISIDFIKITNNSSLSDDVIKARLHAKLGEEPNLSVLEEDFSSIYGLDIFELVDYQIITEDEKTGLFINSVKKSWGPSYLQFGVKLADNFSGDNNYDIGISYTMTEINSLAAEWRSEINIGENPRLFTELHQPLDNSLHYFLSSYAQYHSQNINLFHDGNITTQYRLSSSLIGITAGRELGTWGEFRLGLHRSSGEAEVRIGEPALGSYEFDNNDFFARFSYDKLDNINFPKQGAKATVEWLFPHEALSDDTSFRKLTFAGAVANTWDKNTLILSLNGVTISEENIPIQYDSSLGGFLNLSGYHENELRGNQLLLSKIVYYRKMNDFSLLPLYLGISLESGNVWNDKNDISVNSLISAGSLFVGVDTFFGPVYLGFGHAEGGRNSFYLYLGKSL